MATEQEPAAPAEAAADPYDLGDTNLYPKVEVEPYEPPSQGARPAEGNLAAPQGDSPASPADARPRNPDGTFAPKPSAHPDWLVEQARDAGLGDAEIADLPADAIGRYVQAVHRRTLKLREEFAAQRTVQDGQARPSPTPPPDEDELGVDLSDVHEPIAQALKKLARENKALKQHLGTLNEREERRDLQGNAEKIDAAFEALGPAYAKIVGATPAAQMTDAHKGEYKRRLAILREAGVTDIRQLPRNLKAALREAAETLFGPGAEKPEPYSEVAKGPKPRVSEEDWREAALARPTQRRGAAEPNGTAKAVANAEQRLREMGGDVGGEKDSDITDGLL